MLFLLEKLVPYISSQVELPLSQHDRGVVTLAKEFFGEDKSVPGEVSCVFADIGLLGVT